MRVKRGRRTSKTSPNPSSPATKALGLGVAALAAVPAANAATFTVTNLNDSGAGSLRQAIADANGAAGADVVNFQAGLTGTITLTTGQLDITDSVDIQGPGASTLSVSGNNSSRVFYLYNSSVTTDIRIAGLTITGGASSIGAGIVNFDENLTIEDAVITANQASGDGAGLWSDGFNHTLTIRRTTISGNTSGDDGGGIYVEDTGGDMTIEDSQITGNTASGQGGGIYLYDPDNSVHILSTTISGNTSNTAGGGIYLYSFDSGILDIQDSTISGNSAQAGGGAFLYSPDQGMTLINTTVSGNQATAGNGGGIYLYNLYNTMDVQFLTIANNTASGSGGGIFMNDQTLPIANSIIGDNTAGTDNDLANGTNGGFDLSYTLVESPGGANINSIAGNITGQDPQLGALANNGGTTQTHRPALTSPVINAADPAFAPPPATDQRGFTRVYAGRADMGAVEINGGVIQVNPTTYNVAESGGSVNVTVTRDIGTDPASVSFATANGSATAGSDYTNTAVTVNFVAGDLSENVTIPILNDNVVEGAENFTGTISTPSAGATLGANTVGTVTINDDPAGTIQFSVATVTTPEEVPSVVLTVTRTGGTEGALSANYASANGTALAGSDYTAVAGTVNFPAGDATPQTITIPIIDDGAVEPDETFTVTLTGAAVGSPATAQVTITNADVAPAVPVPALGLFGKLMLGVLSTAAAMWALMRRGASMFLLGALLLGVMAATPASAANGKAEKKHETSKLEESKNGIQKYRGTIQSVTNVEGKVTIAFTSGKSVQVVAKSAQVNDYRGKTKKSATVADLVAGRNVVVKVKKNGHVKIRIVK